MRVERGLFEPYQTNGVGTAEATPTAIAGNKDGADSSDGTKPVENLAETVEKFNKTAAISKTDYRLEIHEATNRQMIQVIKDDEVIMEIPPEEVLDILAKFEAENGVLIDAKA